VLSRNLGNRMNEAMVVLHVHVKPGKARPKSGDQLIEPLDLRFAQALPPTRV
jgi:hypothetical protein